jgi:SAM-dependent methyltransferase
MPPKDTDAALAYEACAQAFLRERDTSLVGADVVERWARALLPGAEVLELGCGGGYPVTRVLHAAGLKLWAVDASPTLVAAFERRFSAVPIQCARAQSSDFFKRSYDAAIAVGLIFLLPEGDQLALIERMATILKPGGRFLFSAPIEVGHWTDASTGLVCQSLGRARYEACLNAAGFRVAATCVDAGESNHFDAQRTG